MTTCDMCDTCDLANTFRGFPVLFSQWVPAIDTVTGKPWWLIIDGRFVCHPDSWEQIKVNERVEVQQ